MMHAGRKSILMLALCLSLAGLSSCIVRRRVITRNGAKTTQHLLTADQKSLITRVAANYDAVHDFNATVDMTPAVGSVEKSKITEYKDVRAYVLFRKLADIRIIGLYPVVRSKAFDMVSNGSTFEIYIPAKNRIITGQNSVFIPAAKSKLENLRPQHFLEALLPKPVQPDEHPALLNLTDEDNASYILILTRVSPEGDVRVSRSIWFDRLNLHMVRQLIFDPEGNILSDARYSDWQSYDGVPFPKHIDINRPRDEYSVVLSVVKMDIDKGVSEDKFVLDRPEGAVLQVLGQQPQETPPVRGKPVRKAKK